MSRNDEDLDVMARTIFGEARGESFDGQIAVGWVIKNRAMKPGWWGHTITEVCRKPFQFSCWNSSDPNNTVILRASLTDLTFIRAYGAAALVMTEDLLDITNGATHYYALYSATPPWASAMVETARIGQHRFMREK